MSYQQGGHSPPFTKGFASVASLMDHFQQHRTEFNFVDAHEYQECADYFLGGPLEANVEECTRANGDVLRYNKVTHEFGVLRKDKVIRTYHVLKPRIHGFTNNYVKFLSECRN